MKTRILATATVLIGAACLAARLQAQVQTDVPPPVPGHRHRRGGPGWTAR